MKFTESYDVTYGNSRGETYTQTETYIDGGAIVGLGIFILLIFALLQAIIPYLIIATPFIIIFILYRFFKNGEKNELYNNGDKKFYILLSLPLILLSLVSLTLSVGNFEFVNSFDKKMIQNIFAFSTIALIFLSVIITKIYRYRNAYDRQSVYINNKAGKNLIWASVFSIFIPILPALWFSVLGFQSLARFQMITSLKYRLIAIVLIAIQAFALYLGNSSDNQHVQNSFMITNCLVVLFFIFYYFKNRKHTKYSVQERE